MTIDIPEDRKSFLLDEYRSWQNGYDGYPSELYEFLGELDMTETEEVWLLENTP